MIAKTTNLEEAVTAFEESWLSQFCYPDSMRADEGFQVGSFKEYADKLGITNHAALLAAIQKMK